MRFILVIGILILAFPACAQEEAWHRGSLDIFDFKYLLPSGWDVAPTQSPGFISLANKTDRNQHCRFSTDVTDPSEVANSHPITAAYLFKLWGAPKPGSRIADSVPKYSLLTEKSGLVGSYSGIHAAYAGEYKDALGSRESFMGFMAVTRVQLSDTVIKPQYRYFFYFSLSCMTTPEKKNEAEDAFNSILKSLDLTVNHG